MKTKPKYYSSFMHPQKWVMILLFGLLSITLSAHPKDNRIKVKNVVIYGESNVMDFWLKFDKESVVSINRTHIQSSEKQTDTRQLFALAVDDFTATSRQIKNDFKRLVRAKDYPTIFIQFEKEILDNIKPENGYQKASVLLQIGGVEREVLIECTAEDVSNNRLYKGTGIIELSDFNLIAPRRLFGLIKIKETIIITFEVLGENQ